MSGPEFRYGLALNRLRKDRDRRACGRAIGGMDDFERLQLFTELAVERLERKKRTFLEIYERADRNWNQAIFIMFFRTLGDNVNREPFMELAARVGYNPVLHVRGSLHSVEALLIGASGLLDCYPEDDYVRSLKSEAGYLFRKYDIEPLKLTDWVRDRIHASNHPVLRLAQAAVFFTRHEFIRNACFDCRTGEDVERLFCTEASGYWNTHSAPGREGSDRRKRIGPTKAALLGINLVAPFLYTYGAEMGVEGLSDQAVNLLDGMAPEDNSIIRRWQACGVCPKHALDTQALLQISNEWCDGGRCESCRIGRRIISEALSAERA